jgi:uncharacterized protein
MRYENQIGGSRQCEDPCPDTVAERQGVPARIPLIKKFRTDRQRYAYDGNTGAVLKLDPITYELLDFITTPRRVEVPASLAMQFPPDQITRSVSRLRALLERSAVFRPVAIKSRLASPAFVAENWGRMAGKFDILGLEVTEDCNMRCRYCVYTVGFKNVRVHSKLAMPWDTARKAIDFFLRNPSRQLPCQYISFWGGEPLINIELIVRCVEYVGSRDPSTTFGVTTNGTLLSDRVRRFLVAHEFQLYVSLDGPREIHDQNRVFDGGGGSFGTIMANLRALRNFAPEYYGRKVRFQCTLSPGVDFQKLLEFFKNSSELIPSGRLAVYVVAPGPETAVTPFVAAEFDKAMKALEQMFLQKVAKGDRGDREFDFLRVLFQTPYLFIHRRPVNPNGFGDTFHTMSACFPGNFKLFVRTNGELLICEKSNDALLIGDTERGLDGKRICDIYRAYHDLHQNECRRCWALRLCAPCYVTDTRRAGKFAACLDPVECEAQRQFWTDKLRKYASVLEQDAGAFDFLNEVEAFRARIPLLDSEPSEPYRGPEIDRAGGPGGADDATHIAT